METHKTKYHEVEIDTYEGTVTLEIEDACSYCDSNLYLPLTREEAISLGEALIYYAKTLEIKKEVNDPRNKR